MKTIADLGFEDFRKIGEDAAKKAVADLRQSGVLGTQVDDAAPLRGDVAEKGHVGIRHPLEIVGGVKTLRVFRKSRTKTASKRKVDAEGHPDRKTEVIFEK